MITIESVHHNDNGVQVDYISHGGMRDALVFPIDVWEELMEYVAVEIELRTKPAPILSESEYLDRMASEGILPEDL